MSDEWLTTLFEEHRPRLRGVALRLLGTPADADDAVQQVWLRLRRSQPDSIDNPAGWLTTVTARVALDMVRARTRRSERAPDDAAPEPSAPDDPAHDALLADAVSSALLVVLDTLGPAERLAFVLHDTFAVPFEEIADVLGRSPTAVKQLAHRARLKVRDGASPVATADQHHRPVVDAFLAAARGGDLGELVALLHPEITLHADDAAVAMGSPARLVGATAVAGMFSGRAQGAAPATLDTMLGLAWIVGGRPKVAWEFTIEHGRVTRIDMIADADSLGSMKVAVLEP
jgi:RNA polymerase sigma-70 factor (ECF subfamily)